MVMLLAARPVVMLLAARRSDGDGNAVGVGDDADRVDEYEYELLAACVCKLTASSKYS